MIVKDVTLATPQENILYDEVLFYLAEKENAGEFLRFWESPELFIVLGRIGKPAEDLNLAAVGKDRIPVLRRTSGGGTVLQGPGCLNFTLLLAKDRDPRLNDLRKSYQLILGKVAKALETLGVTCVFRPISDLALESGEKKFSGNAQHRGRNYILHHGTILYQFHLPDIEKYLAMPKDRPAYRQDRGHLDFVTNIPITPKDFKQALRAQFAPVKDQYTVLDSEAKVLGKLREEKSIVVD
jgi:lipoate---protein ligase